MTLQGKRIIITGASGGLGQAAITALQQEGARVVGIDRIQGQTGSESDLIVADLRDAQATQAAVAAAIARLGGLDILINNAGILDLQDAGARPTPDVVDAIEVHLLGTWRVTSVALPALLASRGRIINVASLFAVVNAPFIPAYAASKRALTAYSDVLRFQYRDRIAVTTVYPGYMRTPIHDAAVQQGLSVAKVVTFGLGRRTLFSMEESLDAAARGLVRACSGRPARDRGLTPLGSLALLAARHTPGLVDWFVGQRLAHLGRHGMQVQLKSAQELA